MNIGDILELTWFGGIFVALYPIYAAIVKPVARNNALTNKRTETGDVVIPACVATVCSLFWPLAVPFLGSYLLHTRRAFKVEEEVVQLGDTAHEQAIAMKMRERAAIEVESTMGMNMVRVPSHYSASGKPQVMHRSDAIKRYGREAKHWDAMPESEAASMEAVVLEDGNDRRDPFMRVPRR